MNVFGPQCDVFKCFHQADPVLADIEKVCQDVDQETPQEPAEAPTQVRENLYFGCLSHMLVHASVFYFIFIKTEFVFVSRPGPYCF